MNRETERLVKQVKKELRELRVKVDQNKNREISKAYRELVSTLQ